MKHLAIAFYVQLITFKEFYIKYDTESNVSRPTKRRSIFIIISPFDGTNNSFCFKSRERRSGCSYREQLSFSNVFEDDNPVTSNSFTAGPVNMQ